MIYNGTRKKALELIARHREIVRQAIDDSAANVADLALLEQINGLVLDPLRSATEPPEVTKVGLGYRALFASGVEISIDRIRESRGELHGELHVKAPTGLKNLGNGHIFGARFNLSSVTSRTSAAKYLSSRLEADWPGMLERFCVSVLEGERKGEEFTTVGQNEPQEPDRWLLKPLLLQGKSTILFGAGGSWKSTLAAACAVSVSAGAQVVPGWRAHEHKVLILDWEDSPGTWNERIRWIAVGAGLNPPEIHYRNMSRPLADEVESVANYVGRNGIAMCVVDSVGLATGAAQEGEGMADGAFRLFSALRELRTTNLLIDHVASAELGQKNGPSNKPYGSVYKMNLARSVFEVRSDKQVGERHEVVLVHTKANVARVEPQELAIEYGGGVIRFHREGVKTQEVMSALPMVEQIARVIGTGRTVQEIADALGTSKAQVGATMRRFKDRFVKLDGNRYGLSAQERM